MKQSASCKGDKGYGEHGSQYPRYRSLLKFFTRYPIFLLAFGPPIFRSHAIDATQGRIDFWSVLQVGWLSLIAARAIWRLLSAQLMFIPKQVRSVLRLAFILGLLFLASATYSPSPAVSAAYSVFYFLTVICVAEFIVDAYRNPPNWVECLFQLRRVSLLLLILVALTILFHTSNAYEVSRGAEVRTIGGSVASLSLISPIICLVSAYSFQYLLEPRGRAFFLFLVGLGAELISRSRFSEAALFLCLLLTFLPWAWNASRRRAYARIAGFMTFAALACVGVGVIGRERIWTIFNKGQSFETIESFSGRTEIWAFVLKYCLAHPQGMGYVAGFRIVFRQYFSLNSGNSLSQLGTAHNTYVDVLAGAGWLALGIYLIMIAKIVKLGWRFAKKQYRISSTVDQSSVHGIRCSLLLLVFCLFYGMGATEFSAPLRGSFGILYAIIAIILGASANTIAVTRS